MKQTFSYALAMGLIASIALSACGLHAQADPGDRFQNRHPRRAEVLHRDRQLNREIQADRGHLNGNYGRLMADQRAIHRQERRDARMNGGFITPHEQHRLNREENHLQRQINRDDQPR